MKWKAVTALFTLVLSTSGAWGEIYKTTDEQGNTVFTDTPPTAESEMVDLPEANVADAVEPSPAEPAPEAKSGHSPPGGNKPVDTPAGSGDRNGDDDYLIGDAYGDGLEQREARKERKELREGERLEHKAPGPHVAPQPHRR